MTICNPGLAAISSIDWGIIVLYAIGMVAVGLYYSRKIHNTDDYLLGGRQMKPLMVGLSLFASLLSTISYLSYTGEMIRYGPMFITGALAFPFVIFVVSSFMIPHFMKLRVTSAYEILEQRLGLSIRLLGSSLFILIRLFWMAVIIHATTDKVLVPVLGLAESWTVSICILMGVVTIIYTSLGGLRAVVFTDVIQSGILFGGGILTVVLVANELGSVRELWPGEWPTHWEKPNWGYDPEARMTLASVFLAVFCWHTCTAGSDQVVIQRYFATRDVKAARSVLVVNLVADFLAMLLMALVGLALIAYFTANPDMFGDNQSLTNNSDQLFPRFISKGLPVGLTGLVISGLLAAAMSSLSSGMNSTSSVITSDFISRLRSGEPDEKSKIVIARWVSVLIGLVVVALSLIVDQVSGNLFEVANKVVNLFVSPLFVLFFLAMFVKSSNACGVWCGALTSITVAVLIAFWEEITGDKGISFLWIMPAAFVGGTVVGTIASFAFRTKQVT
jgi:SSS family solute:Na+ symporter|tara:strand:- start:806 stop:2314 length:1509 start_codon:yes stop_codon:yes gene_type:complete